jgi:hypothetical protein
MERERPPWQRGSGSPAGGSAYNPSDVDRRSTRSQGPRDPRDAAERISRCQHGVAASFEPAGLDLATGETTFGAATTEANVIDPDRRNMPAALAAEWRAA